MNQAEVVIITPFQTADQDEIIAIDASITGNEKIIYWQDLLTRVKTKDSLQCFVAWHEEKIIGYIIGEIRAWEFGQPPCGWVFTLGVTEKFSRKGIGHQLLEQLAKWFKSRSINKIRTMVSVDQDLLHRFFRTHGFKTGPFMQLEMEV